MTDQSNADVKSEKSNRHGDRSVKAHVLDVERLFIDARKWRGKSN